MSQNSSSNLSCGIVGLPNVGKSTLFNALTKNNVLAANYPSSFPAGTTVNFKLIQIGAIPQDHLTAGCGFGELGGDGQAFTIIPARIGDNELTLAAEAPDGIEIF